MKDYTIDINRYDEKNRTLNCKEAIQGRMAENLKRVKSEIEIKPKNRRKPCIVDIKR